MTLNYYLIQCYDQIKEHINNHKMILQYVRNRHNQKCGVVVAYKKQEKVMIGYSLCNKKDRYDKLIGLNKAINRAQSIDSFQIYGNEIYDKDGLKIPFSVMNTVLKVIDRGRRYYKL